MFARGLSSAFGADDRIADPGVRTSDNGSMVDSQNRQKDQDRQSSTGGLRSPHKFAVPIQRNNLPSIPTPFIGREREVAAITGILSRPGVRMLTLTGPGGIGKTRIALQVASLVGADFPDGVVFVELGHLEDAAFVPHEIARTCLIPEVRHQSVVASLSSYFINKRLLLVLDTFEHLLQATSLLSNILSGAPDLKMLLTSRKPLHLRSERLFSVPPMTLPDVLKVQREVVVPRKQASTTLRPEELVTELQKYEAVRFFLDRVHAVNPHFVVTEATIISVARICQRLDALPLAMELAAAHVQSLSVQNILTKLDTKLAFLSGGFVDMPARQQTIRRTIDWSYNLLQDEEKQALAVASVFAGAFTFDGFRGIWKEGTRSEAEVLHLLTTLLDHSLLQNEQELEQRMHPAVEGEEEGEATVGAGSSILSKPPRYRMLGMVREYAEERLQESGESSVAKALHARYFLDLAEEAYPHLQGAHSLEWLGRLATEWSNIRAAIAWALSSGGEEAGEMALRFVGALGLFWEMHGNALEGSHWTLAAISKPEAQRPTEARARALSIAGRLVFNQGDPATRSCYEECLTISRQLDNKVLIMRALMGLGHIARFKGDYETARAYYEESLNIRRGWGSKVDIAHALASVGDLAYLIGDYQSALTLYEECYTISIEVQDKWSISESLIRLAQLSQQQGDLAAAASYVELALALSGELGLNEAHLEALYILGTIKAKQGFYTEAEALFLEQLTLCLKAGFTIAPALLGLSTVALAMNQPVRAAVMLGVVARELPETSLSLDPLTSAEYQRVTSAVRSELDKARWNVAYAEGRVMTQEQIATYAGK